MRKAATLLLCIVLAVNPVSASIFDDLFNKIIPQQPLTTIKKPATEPITDDFKALMDKLYLLNTPQTIQNLNAEMDYYNTKSVKVRVYKIPSEKCEYCGKNFYIVRSMGVVADYPTNDREVVLTYSQVMRMYPFFEDGKTDFFERWQLYAIYKMG